MGAEDGTAVPRWRSSARAQGLGRIVPVRPEGQKPPIFVLQIPRCGAGSLARFLARIYGADGVVTQAERRLDAVFAGHEAPLVADCIVGAVPLVRWQHFLGTEGYGRVTLLRNPWARLVSQINHLAAIGPDRAGPAGSSSQVLAQAVADADFTSRTGLERFFNRLRLVEGGFDNLQTRMLLTGTMSAMVKKIVASDVDVALRELARFSAFGVCEEQLDLQRVMVRLTGADIAPRPEFEAAGKSIVLSVRNSLAREVLTPWIELDQELYTRAKALAGHAQA